MLIRISGDIFMNDAGQNNGTFFRFVAGHKTAILRVGNGPSKFSPQELLKIAKASTSERGAYVFHSLNGSVIMAHGNRFWKSAGGDVTAELYLGADEKGFTPGEIEAVVAFAESIDLSEIHYAPIEVKEEEFAGRDPVIDGDDSEFDDVGDAAGGVGETAGEDSEPRAVSGQDSVSTARTATAKRRGRPPKGE